MQSFAGDKRTGERRKTGLGTLSRGQLTALRRPLQQDVLEMTRTGSRLLPGSTFAPFHHEGRTVEKSFEYFCEAEESQDNVLLNEENREKERERETTQASEPQEQRPPSEDEQ